MRQSSYSGRLAPRSTSGGPRLRRGPADVGPRETEEKDDASKTIARLRRKVAQLEAELERARSAHVCSLTRRVGALWLRWLRYTMTRWMEL